VHPGIDRYQRLPALRIPDRELSPPAGDDLATVGAQGQSPDPRRLGQHFPTGGCTPQFDRAVLGPGRQSGTIRTEGDGLDGG